MTTRPYRSRARARAADETRQRILQAAIGVLKHLGASGFSLETVARAAGVIRVTVYKQFGSRRALLEAVFDALARSGGLHRIAEAMAHPEPSAGLQQLIEIFCGFWDTDPKTFAALQAAASGDAELEASLTERNERRRHAMAVLIDRLTKQGRVSSSARQDLIDYLFVLSSLAVYAQLSVGRSREATCALLQAAAADALARATP